MANNEADSKIKERDHEEKIAIAFVAAILLPHFMDMFPETQDRHPAENHARAFKRAAHFVDAAINKLDLKYDADAGAPL